MVLQSFENLAASSAVGKSTGHRVQVISRYPVVVWRAIFFHPGQEPACLIVPQNPLDGLTHLRCMLEATRRRILHFENTLKDGQLPKCFIVKHRGPEIFPRI